MPSFCKRPSILRRFSCRLSRRKQRRRHKRIPHWQGKRTSSAPAPDNAPVAAKPERRDCRAPRTECRGQSRRPRPHLPRRSRRTRSPRSSGANLQTSPASRASPPRAKSKDAIAALIKTNTAAAADAAEPSTATVAAAQQALVRLGFVLRADGVLGAATRQAIELFERDHGMPADGDLSPRVTRRLSELSGIAIP